MNKSYFNINRNKKNGFTLVELILGLSLIAIVFTSGYSILHFSRKAHTDTVNKMDRQEALKMATKIISKELSTAFYFEIKDTKFDHVKEGDKFIESNGENIKVFKKVEDNWEEDIILDFKNELIIKGSDENETVAIVSIKILDENDVELDSLHTRVFISNMLVGRKDVEWGDDGGSYILYNNTTKESALPTPGISTGCFIATATYGSETHPYIVLLKEFRDDHLANYALGRSFIRNYYRYSPKYASFIEKSSILKFITRVLLAPIVALVFTIIRIPFSIFILMALIFILYKLEKKRKKMKII